MNTPNSMSHLSQKIKELDSRLKGLDPNLSAEQDPEWILSERIRVIRYAMGVLTVLEYGLVPFYSADLIIAKLSAGDMWKSQVIMRLRNKNKKSNNS